MADTFAVNRRQCFQDLRRDYFGTTPCLLRVFDISTKISILQILHCDEDVAFILVPAKELDE